MTPSTSQIHPCPAPSASDGPQEHRPLPTVVPFRASAPRRFRRADDVPEERGAILLFTGVRYERRPEPEPGTAEPQRRWS